MNNVTRRWEYWAAPFTIAGYAYREMNPLGNLGWECFAIVPIHDQPGAAMFYFKRQTE